MLNLLSDLSSASFYIYNIGYGYVTLDEWIFISNVLFCTLNALSNIIVTLKIVSIFRLGYGVKRANCRSSRLSKMYEKFARKFAKFLPRDYVTRIEEIGTCSQKTSLIFVLHKGKRNCLYPIQCIL